ncbi:MAG: hypothetical protein OXD40_15440 [bacterium]|nr:hypothetical protein [bacterium]
MKRTLIAAALAACVASPTEALLLEGERAAENLATQCAPVALHIALWGNAEDNTELWIKLWNAAESRLRSARIFDDENQYQVLNVLVGSHGAATVIEMDLRRFAIDSGHGKSGEVIVWTTLHLMAHGDDQLYRDVAAGHLDQFLAEYLRANPECG